MIRRNHEGGKRASPLGGCGPGGQPVITRTTIATAARRVVTDAAATTTTTRRRACARSLASATAVSAGVCGGCSAGGRRGTTTGAAARTERRDEEWIIVDLDSTNGVVLVTEAGAEIDVVPGVESIAGTRILLGDADLRLVRTDG
jgi:hypothetical protein